MDENKKEDALLIDPKMVSSARGQVSHASGPINEVTNLDVTDERATFMDQEFEDETVLDCWVDDVNELNKLK